MRFEVAVVFIGGSDYVLGETLLTFPSSSLEMQSICISVNITGDDVTETNETFLLLFSVAIPDRFDGMSNAMITIIDDDGEYILQ